MLSLHFSSSLLHDLSDTFASHSQVGGLLAYGVSHIDNPNLKSWQVLFMLLGLVTVLWGCFVGWFLPDSPMRAKCWPAETRVRLVERVRPNMSGLQNKVFKRDQLVEALLDPAVWLLFLLQVLSCLTSGGASAFGNIVITVRFFSSRPLRERPTSDLDLFTSLCSPSASLRFRRSFYPSLKEV